jgi:hypothetical protein
VSLSEPAFKRCIMTGLPDMCVRMDPPGVSMCIKNGIWRWSWEKDLWDFVIGGPSYRMSSYIAWATTDFVHMTNDGWTNERTDIVRTARDWRIALKSWIRNQIVYNVVLAEECSDLT